MLPDLSDAVDLGLVLLDESGTVRQCNRWILRHAGLSAPPLGQDFRQVFPEPVEAFLLDAIRMATGKRLASRLSHALHPSPLPLFQRLRDKPARMRQAVDVLPIRGPRNERWCLIQVRDVSEMVKREHLLRKLARQLNRDLVELKQSRDVLRQRTEEAEAADRAKSVFLSVVTHELRSPLHTILGYAELLRREPVGDTALAQIETLEHSGRQLMRIIDDILQFSRGRESGDTLCPRLFSLREFAAQLKRTIGLQLKSARCVLETSLSPDLPAFIEADEQRLVQVIGNLIDNACKYAPGSLVRLRIESVAPAPTAAAGPQPVSLLLRVEDEGPGIPEEDLEKIFDPFHRLPGSRYQRGLGLGLPIARQIVAQMRGSIVAANRPEGGSVFCVSITVPGLAAESTVAPAALPSPPRTEPRSAGASTLPRTLRRRMHGLLLDGRISRLEELAESALHRHPAAKDELEEVKRYCRLADLASLDKLLGPRRRSSLASAKREGTVLAGREAGQSEQAVGQHEQS